MNDEDVLAELASLCTAQLLNLHWGTDAPKHILFSRINDLILCTMQVAVQEQMRRTVKFSVN